MIQLVLSVCLISDPGHCKDVALTEVADGSPLQCLMQSQAAAAQWVTEHPKWQVRRWKCSQARQQANI